MPAAMDRLRSRLDALLRRPDWVFVLLTLWLGLESFALGPFSYMQLNEFGDNPFPYWQVITSGLLGSGSHYWLPSVACGVDRLANSLMYPQALAFLMWLLPGWAAYQAFLFIHYFFGGYFTCRLCTDDLKTSARAGILAGFAVAYFNAFTGGIGNSIFPFALWAFERLLDAGWRRGILGAALLGLFFSMFSSAVACLPFCFAWAFLWFSVVRRRFSARFLALCATLGLFAVGMHLQEMIAMWLNAQFSHRAQWGTVWACSAADLGRALAQGLRWTWSNCNVPAAVGLLGLAASRFRPGRFAGVFALFLFTVVASGTGEWVKTCLGLASGTLSGLHLHRFFLILPLAGGLVGAAGIELLPGRRWVFPLAMALLFGQTLQSKSKALWEYFFQGGYTSNYRSPVLSALARQRSSSEPFRVATFTHGLLPGYATSYGLESVDGYVNNYPRAYFNLWRKVIEPVMRREPYLEDYFGRWGNEIYLFLHSVDDWPAGIRFTDHYRLHLLSLANTRYIISRHPLEDPSLRLLAPQPSWRSMPRKERIWLRIKELFTGKRYFFIYENTSAFPRAFLVRGVKTLPDEEALWAAMADATLDDLKEAVYVEASRWRSGTLSRAYRKGRVAISGYRTDRLDLEVFLDGPAVLVVSNSLNPYWRCLVDGKERAIVPAYGAFWGVVMGPGDRNVTFSYSPPYRLF
ncbi:MAG: hypothetical protein HY748_11190 [Elusimicrobia bacterium]|nr:hypothetical protein [Elusimicrobiota bacterium]